jgi:hypothetical protein
MSSLILGTLLMRGLGLSWRAGLVVMGAAGLVFGIAFLFLFRSSPQEDSRTNQAERDLIAAGRPPGDVGAPRILPWRRVLRNRSMYFFVVEEFMSAGADQFYSLFLGGYFLTARQIDIGTSGLAIALPLLGGGVGGIAGGYLNEAMIRLTGSRRWGRTIIAASGKAVACGLMFVAIAQQSVAAACWSLFIVKFFADWSPPTVWGTCTDIGGRYSATTFSIVNTAGSVGAAVTPIAFGAILDAYATPELVDGVEKLVARNYAPLFTVVAMMYVASALCWFFINCNQSLERD